MKWWLAIIIALSFIVGMTDWFRYFAWYQAWVVGALAAFVAAVLWHAKKETDGS
jgi:hypothetical protein